MRHGRRGRCRCLTRTPHCEWCATASNWPTSQDDALLCRGYVQDRRRERLRDIGYGRPVEEPKPLAELADGHPTDPEGTRRCRPATTARPTSTVP